MTKTFIDPVTGKKITKAILEKKLASEELKLASFRTAIGSFSQCVVIAAYLNALKKPIPDHFKQSFYGKTPSGKQPDLKTGLLVLRLSRKRDLLSSFGLRSLGMKSLRRVPFRKPLESSSNSQRKVSH